MRRQTLALYRARHRVALFLIERNFAEELIATSEVISHVLKANETADVDWLFSFLSADRKKTYCLYEASSPEAIMEAARLAGIPADVIVEVTDFKPDMFGVGAGRSSAT